MLAKSKYFKIVFSGLGAFSLLALIFGGLQLLNFNRVVVGLSIGNVKAGGLTVAQIRTLLELKIKEFEQKNILLSLDNKYASLGPADLGIKMELEETLSQAFRVGRDANIFAGTIEQLFSLVKGKKISILASIDNEKLSKALENFNEQESPAQNAALKYNSQTDEFETLPGSQGMIIDRAKLTADLLANAGCLANQNIKLQLVLSQPLINENDLAQLTSAAKSLIDKAPFNIQTKNAQWEIKKPDLADWIVATPSSDAQAQLALDKNKINSFLAQLASAINQEPINAKLTWINNELKFITLSQNGQELNFEQSASAIEKGLLAGEQTINLIVDMIKPEISDSSLKELGLTSLIGVGESNFVGSPKNRQANLTLGAAKLNGLLIKPSVTFSFGESIGPIDSANGWLPELVIKNGQTLPGIGGGICQVSTTVFRAAVNAGLKIIERYPHAYPVHYYNPPGFDATVYPPKPDLKFVNDTPNYILLQSRVAGTKLIFEIYGTLDGRQVKVKGPTILQSNPDGSMKTILTQEIWRDGQLEQQNKFYSSYASPALYPVIKTSPTPTPAPTDTN